jgi:predicted nucleic acid-binding protein
VNVIDSSGWLEYFGDLENAASFAPAIEKPADLLVPVISLYEVFKRVYRQSGEDAALEAVALMMQGNVVALDVPLALTAARLSLDLKLPMADSIILATAQAHRAALWTQDADLEGIERVHYIAKT